MTSIKIRERTVEVSRNFTDLSGGTKRVHICFGRSAGEG